MASLLTSGAEQLLSIILSYIVLYFFQLDF